MYSVMIAIEYSYKLDTKNYFNLWCELGRFLHRQSHMYHHSGACYHGYTIFASDKYEHYYVGEI